MAGCSIHEIKRSARLCLTSPLSLEFFLPHFPCETTHWKLFHYGPLCVPFNLSCFGQRNLVIWETFRTNWMSFSQLVILDHQKLVMTVFLHCDGFIYVGRCNTSGRSEVTHILFFHWTLSLGIVVYSGWLLSSICCGLASIIRVTDASMPHGVTYFNLRTKTRLW